ncbi:branched-chain amino acid ABC transporter permease/ATP-binding protein [Nocardia noduli]|uniref:branched-chain amino acid ABC transporter permease/ATP-binding protein n=1 Tax=Nocardia noduli TaxID=2815722 RepID=UPI0020B40CF4|nr:branched-chain amino acid ABC transporter permease/ATP-binding protein [Nocardia noduli]
MGNGAVFGALALAVVLTYRSSGVLNFASATIALFAAYMYANLRQGDLLVLVPGLPRRIHLGGPLGMWPAMVISLLMATALGLVLYLLVFRPLRSSPLVARATAAVGISLAMTALVAERAGTTSVVVEPIFPIDLWQSGSLSISADRVYFAVTMVVLSILLALVFRFTKFGLATRASAETERGAYVSGLSPDRVAAYNWMLSSAVAGLAGILIAPIVPLQPIAYTLFIVPALAAAIVARFEYVIVAVVAGLAIGALQSEAQYLQSIYDSLPSSGLPELVPLILILVALLIRAKPLPSRGEIILQTLGRAHRPQRLYSSAAVATVVAAVAVVVLDDRLRTGLIVSLIMAIIALSSVVVTGYAGQVSLAQLTMGGVAGFLVGPITTSLHIPFPFAPLVAALCAAVLGVAIGLPALRIRGLFVAVVTLAMAFTVEALWFRNTDFVDPKGESIPKPEIFGRDLSIGAGVAYPRVTFGLLCLLVLVAVAIGVAILRRSRLGSEMLAVRANERSAAAAGVSVIRVKILAFGIGAFIAGLGGSMLAYQQQTVSSESFGAMASLGLFATVYIAGATSIAGGILAGFMAASGLLFIVTDELGLTGNWFTAISGILLVITVIFNPEGIVGPGHALLARFRANRSIHRKADAPSAETIGPEEVAARSTPAPWHPGASDTGEVVLQIKGLSVHYGGVQAVKDVDLTLTKGTLVGLIGPNGAGKTTVMDAICGFATASGVVALRGSALSALAPHRRIRAGLGRTFQAIELYDDLSVYENVKVGRTAAAARDRSTGAGNGPTSVDAILDLLEIAEFGARPAGELSQGQRQLVSIARALVGEPTVLLLDEPAGGLDSSESRWLGERLRPIVDSGVTILLVDHDMDLVLNICDTIHVLNFGEVIASGTPAETRANPVVAQAYLGREAMANG